MSEDFERLKALLFDKGNIEFNDKEQKCYLKILRHNYCTFIKELERLEQENKQLKSILTELEEWFKKEKQIAEQNIIESKKWLEIEEEKEHAKSDIHTGKIIRKYIQYGLNKIQELKEKYK